MTDIPEIPPAPVVAPYPALGAPNFNQMAYAVGTGMPGVVSGIREIALAARTCALAARADTLAVEAYVGVAQGAAGTATTKAGESSASAAASAAARDASIAAAGASLESAEDSSASAGAAKDSEDAADRSAQLAAEDRLATEQARDATQVFRDQAEVFASAQFKGTSSTSVVPGAGAKAFAMEPLRSFVLGMYLVVTSESDPATSMSGYVQSYDPATGALVIGVDVYNGAAAKADWVIGVAARAATNTLTRKVVTANEMCVPGVLYIIAAAGITLTLPTSWTAGDPIAFAEAIGGGALYNMVYGATPLRGRAVGTVQMSANYSASGVLIWADLIRGLV